MGREEGGWVTTVSVYSLCVIREEIRLICEFWKYLIVCTVRDIYHKLIDIMSGQRGDLHWRARFIIN